MTKNKNMTIDNTMSHNLNDELFNANAFHHLDIEILHHDLNNTDHDAIDFSVFPTIFSESFLELLDIEESIPTKKSFFNLFS